MEEQRRNRRNLVQNIIITLLSILALSLFAQSQLYNLDLAEGYNDNGSSQAVRALPASDHLIAPLRVAVTGDYGRYGNIALTTGDNGFIDPLGRCLLEALGSARDYTSCAAGDFFQALGAPSLYYDFLEPLPLSAEGRDRYLPQRGYYRPPSSDCRSGQRNGSLSLGWQQDMPPGRYCRLCRQPA